MLVALLLFTVIQPYLPNQFDPYIPNLNENEMPIRNQAPNSTFWFGTNAIGQDLWANIWQGTRNSLFIGFTTAMIEAFIGILVGLLIIF